MKVSLNEGEEAWARLVYRTRDGQPYDVAVLRLEQKHDGLGAVELAAQLPAKGEPVDFRVVLYGRSVPKLPKVFLAIY